MLSKTVSKVSVKLTQPKFYIITFNLKVSDGVVNVIDENFPVEYRTGEDVASKVAEVVEKMQLRIDTYKTEVALLANAALDNAVNTISGGLTL